jgi:hypothetical protein
MGVSQQQQMQQCSQDTPLNGMPDTNEQQQQLNVQQQEPAPDNERCVLQLHSLRASRHAAADVQSAHCCFFGSTQQLLC